MFFYILFLFLHKKISLIVSFFFFLNFRYFIFCQYCSISLLYSLAQLSFSLFVAILGYFLAKSSAKLEQFLVLVPNKKTFAFFLLIITRLDLFISNGHSFWDDLLSKPEPPSPPFFCFCLII